MDPFELCVSPEHFTQQLAYLNRYYRIVPLHDLARAVAAGSTPNKAVAITFDDGYVDNLYHAKPLLERFEAPATVFVTSGAIGGEGGFWWDELERDLLLAPVLPECLAVRFAGRTYRWEISPTTAASALDAETGRRWKATEGDAPTGRQRAFRDLYALLRPLPEDTRTELLDQLRRQVGRSNQEADLARPMSSEELKALVRGGLVDVGAHTVTHPFLSEFPAEVQRQELERSKQTLEQMLERRVSALSYPFGGDAAVGTEAPRLAQDLGYDLACTMRQGPLTIGADPYRLPRLAVADVEGSRFAEQLSTVFGN